MLVLLLLPFTTMAARVMVLTLDGAIGPATVDYVSRGLAHAGSDDIEMVVLLLDTPGGLDTSMRAIVKSIIGSPVAVALYVSPSGARAASAGTYILYASHVAAMAPGTNLGAATPVRIGGSDTAPAPDARAAARETGKTPGSHSLTPSMQKQVNDAAAYIRSLAQLRGRNAQWAEQAVREAVSLSADEALNLRVIDVIAADLTDLLRKLDGRRLSVHGKSIVLHTADSVVTHYDADWRARLLAVITDPSIALLLLTIGIYGLIFEFVTPGLGIGGVLGSISLLLGLYALQLLPVNYAGLALILLGLAFMIAEAFLPSFGVVGLGGVAAFVTGAVILIDTEVPGFGIPTGIIVASAALSLLLVAALVGVALKSRRRAAGSESVKLIGAIAEVVDASRPETWARLQGELWKVACRTPLRAGQKVRVVSRRGLVLDVAPVDNLEPEA